MLDYSPFTADQCRIQRIKESEQREKKQVRIEVIFQDVEHDIIYFKFPVLVIISRRHNCPPSLSHPSSTPTPSSLLVADAFSSLPLAFNSLSSIFSFLSFAALLSSGLLIFFRRPVGHKLHQ